MSELYTFITNKIAEVNLENVKLRENQEYLKRNSESNKKNIQSIKKLADSILENIIEHDEKIRECEHCLIKFTELINSIPEMINTYEKNRSPKQIKHNTIPESKLGKQDLITSSNMQNTVKKPEQTSSIDTKQKAKENLKIQKDKNNNLNRSGEKSDSFSASESENSRKSQDAKKTANIKTTNNKGKHNTPTKTENNKVLNKQTEESTNQTNLDERKHGMSIDQVLNQIKNSPVKLDSTQIGKKEKKLQIQAGSNSGGKIDNSKSGVISKQNSSQVKVAEGPPKSIANENKKPEIFNKKATEALENEAPVSINEKYAKEKVEIDSELYKKWKSHPECVEKHLINIQNITCSSNIDWVLLGEEIEKLKYRFDKVEEELHLPALKKVYSELLNAVSKEEPKSSDIKSLAGKMLKIIKPLDLEMIKLLIEKNNLNASMIENKDIILLLGATGSGKSTSFNWLAGSVMVESKVKGINGIIAKENTTNPEIVKLAIISPSSMSETKTLYATKLFGAKDKNSKELEIFLCDTPGFADNRGAEVDISNGVCLMKSVGRALSVRPIIHISFNDLRTKLEGLGEMSQTISKVLPNFTKYSESITYFFTRFLNADNKQWFKASLINVCKNIENYNHLNKPDICDVLNDLHEKITDNEFDKYFINPLDQAQQKQILNEILKKKKIAEPHLAFKDFISEDSRRCAYKHLDMMRKVIKFNITRGEASLVENKIEQAHYLEKIFENSQGMKEPVNRIFEEIDTYFAETFSNSVKAIDNSLYFSSSLTNIRVIDDYFSNFTLSRKFSNILLKSRSLKSPNFQSENYLEVLKQKINNMAKELKPKNFSEFRAIIRTTQNIVTNFGKFTELKASVQDYVDAFLAKSLTCESVLIESLEAGDFHKFFEISRVHNEFKVLERELNLNASYREGKTVNYNDVILELAEKWKKEIMESLDQLNPIKIEKLIKKLKNLKIQTVKADSKSISISISTLVDNLIEHIGKLIELNNDYISQRTKTGTTEIENIEQAFLKVKLVSELSFVKPPWKDIYYNLLSSLLNNLKTNIKNVRNYMKKAFLLENHATVDYEKFNSQFKLMINSKWFMKFLNKNLENELQKIQDFIEEKVRFSLDIIKSLTIGNKEDLKYFLNFYSFVKKFEVLDSMNFVTKALGEAQLVRIFNNIIDQHFNKTLKNIKEILENSNTTAWEELFSGIEILNIYRNIDIYQYQSKAEQAIKAIIERHTKFLNDLNSGINKLSENNFDAEIAYNLKYMTYLENKFGYIEFSQLSSDLQTKLGRKLETIYFDMETNATTFVNGKYLKNKTLLPIEKFLLIENDKSSKKFIDLYFKCLSEIYLETPRDLLSYSSDFFKNFKEINYFIQRMFRSGIKNNDPLKFHIENFYMRKKLIVLSDFIEYFPEEISLIKSLSKNLQEVKLTFSSDNFGTTFNKLIQQMEFLENNYFDKVMTNAEKAFKNSDFEEIEKIKNLNLDPVGYFSTNQKWKSEIQAIEKREKDLITKLLNSIESDIKWYEKNPLTLIVLKLSKAKTHEKNIKTINTLIVNNIKKRFDGKLQLSNFLFLEATINCVPKEYSKILMPFYYNFVNYADNTSKADVQSLMNDGNYKQIANLLKEIIYIKPILSDFEQIIASMLSSFCKNIDIKKEENWKKLEKSVLINSHLREFLPATSIMTVDKIYKDLNLEFVDCSDNLIELVSNELFFGVEKENLISRLEINIQQLRGFLLFGEKCEAACQKIIPAFQDVISNFILKIEESIGISSKKIDHCINNMDLEELSFFNPEEDKIYDLKIFLEKFLFSKNTKLKDKKLVWPSHDLVQYQLEQKLITINDEISGFTLKKGDNGDIFGEVSQTLLKKNIELMNKMNQINFKINNKRIENTLKSINKLIQDQINNLKDLFINIIQMEGITEKEIKYANQIQCLLESKIIKEYHTNIKSEHPNLNEIFKTLIEGKAQNYQTTSFNQNAFCQFFIYLKSLEKHALIYNEFVADILNQLIPKINDINLLRHILDESDKRGLVLVKMKIFWPEISFRSDKEKYISRYKTYSSTEKSNMDTILQMVVNINGVQNSKNLKNELITKINEKLVSQKQEEPNFTVYMTQDIPELILLISTLWSLINLDDIYFRNDISNYIWIPTQNQISQVREIFEIKNKTFVSKLLEISSNHKDHSILVAITAVLFAIFGCDSRVGFHSKKKAQVEYKKFINLFIELNIDAFITYDSHKNIFLASSKRVTERYNNLNSILPTKNESRALMTNRMRPKILLAYDAHSLLHSKFLGKTFSVDLKLEVRDTDFAKFVSYLFEYSKGYTFDKSWCTRLEEVKKSEVARVVFRKFDALIHPMLDRFIERFIFESSEFLKVKFDQYNKNLQDFTSDPRFGQFLYKPLLELLLKPASTSESQLQDSTYLCFELGDLSLSEYGKEFTRCFVFKSDYISLITEEIEYLKYCFKIPNIKNTSTKHPKQQLAFIKEIVTIPFENEVNFLEKITETIALSIKLSSASCQILVILSSADHYNLILDSKPFEKYKKGTFLINSMTSNAEILRSLKLNNEPTQIFFCNSIFKKEMSLLLDSLGKNISIIQTNQEEERWEGFFLEEYLESFKKPIILLGKLVKGRRDALEIKKELLAKDKQFILNEVISNYPVYSEETENTKKLLNSLLTNIREFHELVKISENKKNTGNHRKNNIKSVIISIPNTYTKRKLSYFLSRLHFERNAEPNTAIYIKVLIISETQNYCETLFECNPYRAQRALIKLIDSNTLGGSSEGVKISNMISLVSSESNRNPVSNFLIFAISHDDQQASTQDQNINISIGQLQGLRNRVQIYCSQRFLSNPQLNAENRKILKIFDFQEKEGSLEDLLNFLI